VATLNISDRQNRQLFYHTTSWVGANSITQQIARHKGRTCLDFGLSPGFYMSDTLDTCVGWAQAKRQLFSSEVAILIFALPRVEQYPTSLKYRVINDPEWSQVTKHSRLCLGETNFTHDHPYIRTCDLLYGNMVSNPDAVKKHGKEPITHKLPLKQLVSKSDAADKFIRNCLVGCVFFQKAAAKA